MLALIAWDGLSQRDAARVARLSPVALRMRLSRARRRLADALQDPDPQNPQPTLEHLS